MATDHFFIDVPDRLAVLPQYLLLSQEGMPRLRGDWLPGRSVQMGEAMAGLLSVMGADVSVLLP